MFNETKVRIDKHIKNLYKELENIKKNQTEFINRPLKQYQANKIHIMSPRRNRKGENNRDFF